MSIRRNANPEPHCYSNGDAHAYRDRNCYCHSYGNCDSDRYAQTDSVSKSRSSAKGSSNSAAAPLGSSVASGKKQKLLELFLCFVPKHVREMTTQFHVPQSWPISLVPIALAASLKQLVVEKLSAGERFDRIVKDAKRSLRFFNVEGDEYHYDSNAPIADD